MRTVSTKEKLQIIEIGSYDLEVPNFCGLCSFCSPIKGSDLTEN